MTVRILSDYHHHALAESLLIMFEDRGILGPTEVWFPFGMDWFDREVWNFERTWHGDAVAKQYLEGVWSDADVDRVNGRARRDDPRHPGRRQRGVTLEAALEMRFDLVISSLPANDAGFRWLADQTGAKLVVQIGNNMQSSAWDLADAGMVTSTLHYTPSKPYVIHHQEFDLEVFRAEWPPATRDTVASFIQCFAENKVPYAEFLDLARKAPDLRWQVFGAYGSHPLDEFACGDLGTTPAVADAMRATRTIWHSKSWSDGFGHVIHNAFAVGRPVVGRASYYQDKLAGPLWVDGVTSFDIDRRSDDEVLALLRRLRDDDDHHRRISENAAARFREVVDYDAEAAAVKAMLESVL